MALSSAWLSLTSFETILLDCMVSVYQNWWIFCGHFNIEDRRTNMYATFLDYALLLQER